MSIVYLGLGTNIGDRKGNLEMAKDLISNFPKTDVTKVSNIYETEPWGYTEQDKFLNLCLKIETDLKPHYLLKKCQQVEQKLKRERKIKWGPRTIDVDILLYDDLVLEDEELIIPHPRIQERAFVLVPLGDLDKNLVIKEKSIKEWIEVIGSEGVNRVD